MPMESSFGRLGRAFQTENNFALCKGPGTYVSQQIAFPASGTYELNYYAGGRYDNGDPQIYGGDTNYGLILDSTLLADGTTTSNAAMTEQEPTYFSATAGNTHIQDSSRKHPAK